MWGMSDLIGKGDFVWMLFRLVPCETGKKHCDSPTFASLVSLLWRSQQAFPDE